MSSIFIKIKAKLSLIKRGEFKLFFRGVIKYIYSESVFYGFKRDLDVPIKIEQSKVNLTIRLFEETDKKYFENEHDSDRMVKANIPTCYVAVNEDNEPCYRQWVMTSDQNNRIYSFFDKNSFPILKPNEALIEGVLTLPSYRGLKIMPQALDMIINLNNSRATYKYAIAFVKNDNVPSLKGFKRAGFQPFIVRKEKFLLFKKTITFNNLSELEMVNYTDKISKLNILF